MSWFLGFITVSLVLFGCVHSVHSKDFENVGTHQKQNKDCNSDIDCPDDMECHMLTCQPVRKERRKRAVSTANARCQKGELYCHDKTTCGIQCDNIAQCPEAEDEVNCSAPCTDCEDGKLLCPDFTTCAKRCNAVAECPGEEDETHCTEKCADCHDNKLLCHDKVKCATQCNNVTECTGGEDEANCTDPCSHIDECLDKYALIYKCDEFSTELTLLPNYYIYYHQIGPTETVKSAEQCIEKCKNTANCKNVELRKDGLACSLNSITGREAILKKALRHTLGFDMYVPKCVKCTTLY